MDSAPFAAFNVLFLTRRIKEDRGVAAAAAYLGKWLPGLLKGLELIPMVDGSSLAYNDPANPMVGYGFEDSVAKVRRPLWYIAGSGGGGGGGGGGQSLLKEVTICCKAWR